MPGGGARSHTYTAIVPRFFVPASAVVGGRGTIEGADAAHLARSLRARPGELVVVADDGGREHGLRLEEVRPERVTGSVAWTAPATGEPRLRVHVLQALAAPGMDEAVAALAQVGAASIRPVLTRRTTARLDAPRRTARQERWHAIAREGAALAGRGWPPEVHPPLALPAAVAALGADLPLLVCVPDAPTALPHWPMARGTAEVAVLIGPEGGLDAAELESLLPRGTPVHLGARVLPARLAGMVAVSLLLAVAGDLDAGVATREASAEAGRRAREGEGGRPPGRRRGPD